MSDLFSAQERAALRADGAAAAANLVAEPVRLEAHERSLRRHLPALQERTEALFAALQGQLRLLVQRPVQIIPSAAGLMGRAQLSASVGRWGAALALRSHQGSLVGYLALDDSLCLSLVELAYGAKLEALEPVPASTAAAGPPRQDRVAQQIVTPLLLQGAEAFWRTLAARAGTVPVLHTPLERLPLALPADLDAAWHAQLRFSLGPREAAIDLLLVPHLVPDLLATAAPQRLPARQAIAAHLLQIPLEVTALLGQAQVPVSRMSAWSLGDMVWLDQAHSEPLPLLVAGICKFTARPLQRHGALGVEIVTRLP